MGVKFLQAASSFSKIIGYARIVASIGAFHNIAGKADYSLPTVESMIHVQRLMKAQNPKIGAVNLDELNDARLVKKLDDSGLSTKHSPRWE